MPAVTGESTARHAQAFPTAAASTWALCTFPSTSP